MGTSDFDLCHPSTVNVQTRFLLSQRWCPRTDLLMLVSQYSILVHMDERGVTSVGFLTALTENTNDLYTSP